MAITFTLQSAGPNHLVYLADSDGDDQGNDAGVIQWDGAGDADVALSDAVVPPAGASWNAGLLKEIVDVAQSLAPSPGAARRQLMDRGGVGLPTNASEGILNVNGKRARAYVVPIAPAGGEVLKPWAIDAQLTVYGAANRGEYVVSSEGGGAGAQRALVVIEALGTPQQF